MNIDDKIENWWKLQYDINREEAKISALTSGIKTDKYEYLTGEEILQSNQRRRTEQAKLTRSLIGKALEKQTKTIENQGKNQIKAVEDHGIEMVLSNELFKKDFNVGRDSIIIEEQQKYLMNLLPKDFQNLEI